MAKSRFTARGTVPTRVDLGGGTADLWPISQVLEHKTTVNFGITLDATATLEINDSPVLKLKSEDQNIVLEGDYAKVVSSTKAAPMFATLVKKIWSKDLPGFTLTTRAKSPAGAGLGGSSALMVLLVRLIKESKLFLGQTQNMSEDCLVQTAQDIEAQLIHAPTGCQDYWGALRGNINILTFPAGGTHVDTMDCGFADQLESALVLCYSGQSRASALNNWLIFKEIFNGNQELIAKFEAMGELAENMAVALQNHDLLKVLDLSHKEWDVRRGTWPSIETTETKAVDAAARSAGALFSRVCGAGGGGVVAIFCPPEKKLAVIEKLQKNGMNVLKAGVSRTGIQIELNT